MFKKSLALLVMLTAAPVWACDTGSIRLWAFDQPRDVHKLCVIANGGDAEGDALYADLAARLAAQAPDLNVEPVRIRADDPELRWPALALPSVPPVLPVTVLVGWDSVEQRPFLIDHWEPAPTEAGLAVLAASPVREAVQRDVVGHWAVVLYAPGTGESEPVVEATAKRWAQEHPPGVAVARLDRADPKERLLRAFIGLRPDGPDWVGVVFGRGKLLAPPLEGPSITQENLNRLLDGLLEVCTCLVAGTSLGVDIPMAWPTDLDEQVVALGSDAYIEAPEGVFVSASAPVALEPAVRRRVPMAALVAVGASVLLVLLATGAVLWRMRAA